MRVHLHQKWPTLIIILLELSLDYNPAADITCDNFNTEIFLFTLVVNLGRNNQQWDVPGADFSGFMSVTLSHS